MGLIRSGMITLDAYSEEEQLTACLWPIVREMIKTAIENRQQLIVEGCYISVRWQEDFSAAYLQAIRSVWLLMSDAYICDRFDEILAHADIIEQRKADDCTMAELREDNARLRRPVCLVRPPSCADRRTVSRRYPGSGAKGDPLTFQFHLPVA